TGTSNTGNAFVKNMNEVSLTLGASSVGGTMIFSNNCSDPSSTDPAATAGIVVNVNLAANIVTLSTVASHGFNNGNITVNSGKSISGVASINLLAGGSGNITQSDTAATLFSPAINVNSVSGDVGSG